MANDVHAQGLFLLPPILTYRSNSKVASRGQPGDRCFCTVLAYHVARVFVVMPLGEKRRNGFEISRDILIVCLKSENKTRVVYRANLNSLRINDYLNWLVKTGLLAKESTEKGVVFRTTSFGLQFLKSYYQEVDLSRRLKRVTI